MAMPQLDVRPRGLVRMSVLVALTLTAAPACSPREFSLGRVGDGDGGTDGGATGIWVQAFPGADDQRVRALIVDDDGTVFVAGQTPGRAADEGRADVFVASLSADGRLDWSTTPPGRNHGFVDDAVAVRRAGSDVVVIGSSGVTSGESIVFADRFSRAAGAAGVQAQPFGPDAGNQIALAVADEGTRRLIGGVLQGTPVAPPPWLASPPSAVDQDSGLVAAFDADRPVWGRSFVDRGVRAVTGVALRDGTAYVAGLAPRPAAAPGADELGRLVLLELDAAGEVVEDTILDGAELLSDVRLAQASDGTLLAIGGFAGTLTVGGSVLRSQGEQDVFVAGFDRALSPLWAVALMGGNTPHGHGGHALAAAPGGAVFACGRCAFPGATDPDEAVPVLAFVSSAGVVGRWTPLAATGEVEVDDVWTPDGAEVYVAGALTGTLDAASRRVTSTDGWDGFVLLSRLR